MGKRRKNGHGPDSRHRRQKEMSVTSIYTRLAGRNKLSRHRMSAQSRAPRHKTPSCTTSIANYAQDGTGHISQTVAQLLVQSNRWCCWTVAHQQQGQRVNTMAQRPPHIAITIVHLWVGTRRKPGYVTLLPYQAEEPGQRNARHRIETGQSHKYVLPKIEWRCKLFPWVPS